MFCLDVICVQFVGNKSFSKRLPQYDVLCALIVHRDYDLNVKYSANNKIIDNLYFLSQVQLAHLFHKNIYF